MDQDVRTALGNDLLIDITTIGRHSGAPRRIEIWFHNIDGRIFITGLPGPRSWYANLLSNAAFTFHLKESLFRDLPAMAIPIVDRLQREEILGVITSRINSPVALADWVAGSPLVEVKL